MNSGFNFAEIDRLEKAWPQIKNQYLGRKLQKAPQIKKHLNWVGVSARDAVGQHAPEDMLAFNMAGFSAAMQHEMGLFERGRVFHHLGLVPAARSAFYESAKSGEADALVGSCDAAAEAGMEHYAHYYKGLVLQAMENEDDAMELFKVAHQYPQLGNRPAVKLIGHLYSKHELEEGRRYLEDGIRRNLLSDGILRHIAKYLSLKGAPASAVRDFIQVCVRNGRHLDLK